MLQVAPSAYWLHVARRRNPELRSKRAKRDEWLMVEIRRVWNDNHQVYGARKVWVQLNREGITVARCTVRRLMRQMGLRGCAPREDGAHHAAGSIASLPAGSGESRVPCRASGSAVGV